MGNDWMDRKNLNLDNVLILAPHTDDGELGCGGTIAKLLDSGANVRYVAFSSANDSLPSGFPKGTLKKELYEATEILGLKRKDVSCLDFKVRTFSEHRQEILDEMLKLRNDLNPDAVFSPSLNDLHQDHKTVAEEARRMFKRTTIFGYELPWNNISFDTQSFVVLEREHLERKMKALRCYKSQAHREYLNDRFIESLAIARGVQVNAPYAEAFEVVRLVIR
jgi:LmbE family N-acetylglucosaminyl deacetylase